MSESPGSPPPIIRLDDFLKRTGMVGTGGEAKLRIQSGEVTVNGEVETRRRKQLSIGDVVQAAGQTLTVTETCFDP
jgi:ribosome-associated protein